MLGAVTTWKHAPRVVTEVSRSFSSTVKFGKVKPRAPITSSGTLWRLKLKPWEQFPWRGVLKGELSWVVEESTCWHFVWLGHLCWGSWERHGTGCGVEWRWWPLSWHCLATVSILWLSSVSVAPRWVGHGFYCPTWSSVFFCEYHLILYFNVVHL